MIPRFPNVPSVSDVPVVLTFPRTFPWFSRHLDSSVLGCSRGCSNVPSIAERSLGPRTFPRIPDFPPLTASSLGSPISPTFPRFPDVHRFPECTPAAGSLGCRKLPRLPKTSLGSTTLLLLPECFVSSRLFHRFRERYPDSPSVPAAPPVPRGSSGSPNVPRFTEVSPIPRTFSRLRDFPRFPRTFTRFLEHSPGFTKRPSVP